MRLSHFIRGFTATILSTGILATAAVAAPPMPGGASIESDVVVNVTPADILNAIDLQPVQNLPGKIGSIAYDSDGKCLVLVLGGASNLTGAEVRTLFFGQSSRRNFGPLANSKTLLMCQNGASETEVVLANAAGVKKLFSRRPRVNGSSIISTAWSGPNKLATALIGRKVVVNGARFISNDYDVHFGTDGVGKVYFIILDRVANKFVYFHQSQGGYHAPLTPGAVAIVQNRLGLAIAQAPRIMLAD